MTRSEEQLQVGTEKVEAGRARLRKYVVTGNSQSVQSPGVSGKRSGWSGNPSPTPTAATPCPVRTSPTRPRSSSHRGTPGRDPPRPSRSNGSGSAPKPSPTGETAHRLRSARNRSRSTTPPAATERHPEPLTHLEGPRPGHTGRGPRANAEVCRRQYSGGTCACHIQPTRTVGHQPPTTMIAALRPRMPASRSPRAKLTKPSWKYIARKTLREFR